jgi:hypothetical protein
MAYQSSTVGYCGSCTPQLRTCTNGVLSGSYTKKTCSSAIPPILALDTGATSGALHMGSGNGITYIPNGPVYVNSSSATAMQVSSAKTVSAPQYNVVGSNTSGFNYYTNSNYPSGGYLRTGKAVIADPVASIPAPNPATMVSQTMPGAVGGVYTVQPGVYATGISVTGTNSLVMAPGIYYMTANGFSFNAFGGTPGSLIAEGVMIYNAGTGGSDLVLIEGSGPVMLSPPTSGIYKGITLFQNRASAQLLELYHTSIGSVWNITGAIYASGGLVGMIGANNEPSYGSQIVGWDVAIQGTGNMTITGNYPVCP